MFFQRPIAIGLSPNTETDDVLLALQVCLRPWIWLEGKGKAKLQQWFETTFNTPHVFLYNSGRSALYMLLKAFGIGKGDEVIVQAFSCVAVPNSVLWNGAKPIYSDIDESFNLSVKKLEKLITKQTKAIIIQHTFGIPADLTKIIDVAKKNNVLIIEDCAHALGAIYNKNLLGSFGDAAFFSFGRDKVVSSVFGGAAIVSPRHKQAAEKLKNLSESLSQSRPWWIFQQLFHPVSFAVILPLYSCGIGKLLLVILQKLHILSFPVYPEEKKGKQPQDFPAKLPNALAVLANHQIAKLGRFNRQRQEIAVYYRKNLPFESIIFPPKLEGSIYLRFPIRIKNPQALLAKLRKKGILLGNWYHAVIDPQGTEYAAIFYTPASCPNAELFATQIINLPTRISLPDAMKVVEVIKSTL